ncbi:MAG: hypothetical protein Q4D26_10430 [Clostridia bacterium]|nr:hypothetical protein [Clostridia bacterium]
MLTQQAINDFKDFIDRNIVYAYVTINDNKIKYNIHKKERLADGKVAIYLQITPQEEVKISKIELYNRGGKIWVEKNENIILNKVQNGVLYRFVFDFKEEEISNVQ